MSTSYYIYRFAKPSKKELSLIDYYSDYDLFPVYDVENEETKESIKLFRNTDKAVENIKRVSNRALQNYEKVVQTKCIALKMECLWNSNDVHYYPDKTRIYKYFPALRTYQFVPICNSILAKAEIPFLIFERNKGKCFLEMC